MVFGWRKAFCKSLPREPNSGSAIKPIRDESEHDSDPLYPSLRCRTTSVTIPTESASAPASPRLHCNNKKLFQSSSTPSSPRSHSTFSIIKSTLRFSENRCGLCLHSVKRGRGVAIFTAECSHGFHFPCIAGHVKNKGSHACPTCGIMWKQTPLLPVNDLNLNPKHNATSLTDSKLKKQNSFELKVYNDDEPLASLTPKARFNPIPESDESCDEDSICEFQGFHVSPVDVHKRDVDVRLLPDAAIISANRSYETHAVVLRVKAPLIQNQRRASIDLVIVVDVSAKMSNESLQMMKRTMRVIISSLSSSDRLSIVAFSSYSKRLLHLKRMASSGKRAAYRLVKAMAVVDGSSNATDAVKKAVKVLEDRTEKNTVASIILLSDVPSQLSDVSSTRYQNITVHTLKLTVTEKTVGSLLNGAVQDLQLQLGIVSGSSAAEIAAVYSHAPPLVIGSSTVQIGELYANEEREIFIELKIPSSAVRAHRVLSVRCSYRESVSQDIIHCNEQALVVPRPQTVRSSALTIQRMRNVFITTRALAESCRLSAKNDFIGAYNVVLSARAAMHQPGSDCRELVASLEAEMRELHRRRQAQGQAKTAAHMDENCESFTPTSAWRVAEKLAKVATVRKSLNRVSDLHGFENAGF
ncbi:putative E3 ubiquitin-protein ligase EDA40 [Bidens hawaiensis]|uniref:putative E3 ubiquitin-protein ligase EDA40 n=1 Tax=Bidens hawaiensis TaxID=980011 RepID=UPI00404B6ACE